MLRAFLSCLVIVGSSAWSQPAHCLVLEGLDSALNRLSFAYGIPGSYTAIVARDRVLYARAAGDLFITSGNTTARAPLAPYMRVGSITKTFNALLALRLVEQGRISLSMLCPNQLSLCPQRTLSQGDTDVNLAELLEHTSGMSDLLPKEFATQTSLPLAAAAKVAPESRLIQWRPGYFSSYSNNNAAALSGLLALHTGSGYETLLNTQVFVPLGLTSATFARSRTVRAALPRGYARDGKTALPYWHMIYPALGGLNISVAQMIPFVQLFLNRGRHQQHEFLRETSISRMEYPETSLAARAGLRYGYGLGLYQWYRRRVLFFGHDGDADGYLMHFAYAPQLGFGYVLAINSDNRPGLRALRQEIEMRMVGAGLAPLPSFPLEEPARDRIVGDYQAVTARFPRQGRPAETLRVILEGGQLITMDAAGERRELIPVAPNLFRRAEDGAPTVVLTTEGGALYLLGDDLGNYRKRSRSMPEN